MIFSLSEGADGDNELYLVLDDNDLEQLRGGAAMDLDFKSRGIILPSVARMTFTHVTDGYSLFQETIRRGLPPTVHISDDHRPSTN